MILGKMRYCGRKTVLKLEMLKEKKPVLRTTNFNANPPLAGKLPLVLAED